MVMDIMTGNAAAAWGARLSRAEVIAAYPITPQTTIVEKVADFIAAGEYNPKFIKVESEHSAMAASIAASQAGARAFTATSSHGLMLMHEMLVWASGARVPVVMSVVCRANGPPWSVWADHHDALLQRDTGWMQVFVESNQEVLDTVIKSFKVAENKDIMLPIMVMEDAFILSHTFEQVDIPDAEKIDEFLPKFVPDLKLMDLDKPYGYGSLVMPDNYMEFRYNIAKAMEDSRKVMAEVDKEFYEIFGRGNEGPVELYKTEDADAVLVIAGSVASTAKDVVDEMRKEGKNVGLARLRVFRPFPTEEFQKLGRNVPAIGVVDRSYGFGAEGDFASEIKAALYGLSDTPIIKNYIAGIGGRDITPQVIRKMYDDILNVKENGLDVAKDWVQLHGGDKRWW